jgi:sugar-specific transcriptional regulator TrmB/DNA-binding CsgD family transcriptional regulator
VLAAVGVSESEEQVYRALLDQPVASPAELAANVDLSEQRIRRILATLARLGLAVRLTGRAVRYAAVPPDVAVGGLLVRRYDELNQVRTALTELVRASRMCEAGSTDVLRILCSPQEVRQYLDLLQRTVREEMRFFVRLPYVVSGNEEQFAAAERGVRYRTVYERGVLERPEALTEITAYLSAGEQVRVTAALPLKFAVADRETALLPVMTEQTADRAGYLLTRSSAIVDALVALFDLVWERATPLRLDASGGAAEEDVPLDAEDLRVLTLMLSGLPDKAVAGQLGSSRRTVQRRIQRLMDLTGTSSRMQLAWYVAHRGWL